MASRWTRIPFQTKPEITPARVDFCLPNLLAGGVGIVAAQAGIGKTSLLLQLGAAVAAGIPVAGGALPAPETSGPVVFLAAEDPPIILGRRAHFLAQSLLAQGHGNEVMERLQRNLQLLSLNGEYLNLLSPGHMNEPAVDRLTRLAKSARLLILDPLRQFHLCDEEHYSHMALLFRILTDIAAEGDCTILFAHHLPPETGGDSDGAHGSSAFINATRWVLELYPMSVKEAKTQSIAEAQRSNFVLTKMSKSNYGPRIGPFWLERSSTFDGVFQHYLPAASSD